MPCQTLVHSLPQDSHGIRHLEFEAMGSRCTIKFRHPDMRESMEFATEALVWIRVFESKFSRFDPLSLVSRVNASAGGDWVPVDASMERMLRLADQIFHRSHGILDASLLPLLRVWDWRSVHFKLPSPTKIKAAHALTGWEKVQRRPGHVRLPKAGMGLDFGCFGKEYAVDHLARLATRRGISDALIDLGRDLFALGANGTQNCWTVGIEDGSQPGQCWAGLKVTDLAVSTSGDSTRHFILDGTRYGHIIDPRSGWPVANGMRAVTVIGPSCVQAGIHSTMVFVLGADEGMKRASHARGVEVCAQSDSSIRSTRNFDRRVVALV